MKISFLTYEAMTQLAELDRRMGRIAELGYQGIELSAFHPMDYDIDEVAKLTRKHRLPVVSLLSGWSYGNEGLCLASPDAGVRARAVERLNEYVGQAAPLQAIVVIGMMQGLRSDEADEGKANERIAAGLKQVAATAERQGVNLVLEPVNHLQVGFNHTAAEALALVERVGSPALGTMLDTIHMNIEERSIIETIQTHGPHIRHFHLCETNGAPFGTGNLDFANVLATLEATGYAHFLSVKIYRNAGWEEAARSAMEFLTRVLGEDGNAAAISSRDLGK